MSVADDIQSSDPLIRDSSRDIKNKEAMDDTVAGMEAYSLARQVLRARNPKRWGTKGVTQDDMRSTFVWLYLLLKHGTNLSRKLVASRVSCCARRIKGKPGKDARPAVTWAHTNSPIAIDFELAESLGFYQVLNGDSRTFGAEVEVHWIYLNLLYDLPSDKYRLVQAEQGSGGQYTPLSPLLFGIGLSGSLFTGGVVEIDTPVMFLKKVEFTLRKGYEEVLGRAEAILTCTGDLHRRVSRVRIPEEVFDALSVDSLGEAVLDLTLGLDINGIFVLNAIHALFPYIQPATEMRIRIVLGYEWYSFGAVDPMWPGIDASDMPGHALNTTLDPYEFI